jgi:outer membrane protein assembly factor BamB
MLIRLKSSVVGFSAMLAVTMISPMRAADAPGDRFWPQWRGPHGTGVSSAANPPSEWSETRNVKWKVEIPGRGSASPIVWGDRVFVLSAIPAGAAGGATHAPRGGVQPRTAHRFMVYAIDRATGRTVWEQVAREATPHEGSHPDNGTWASSSASTDGERVFAYFESQGLYAYDMTGKLLWQKDFGKKIMRNEFGEGTTPALYGNRLVLTWDHQGASFIVALDANTGNELWRVPREEIDTWSTPLIVEHEGRAQVITNGMNRLRSYDLETGKIVWESAGTTMNPIPSPVAADGMVFLMSGFRGNNLKAIKLADARGDITRSGAIAWSLDRDTPYVPSPLLYGGILYFLKTNSGVLSAFDAKTGTPHYQVQRLDLVSEVFASPVGAGNRVYIVDRDGTTLVLRLGPKYEVLAKNSLDDGFDASPALVDNEIFMRGYRYLYCITGS